MMFHCSSVFLTVLFFSCFLPFWGIAQICTGNLGDNIFEEGDFGIGTANNLLDDPNIAPGYNYTQTGPPS
ncbi:MAG: hypothetical protein AAF849_24565, partial [Bacteroidota bacterium]